MNIRNITTVGATALLSLSMIPTVSAYEGGYVSDGSNDAVRDGSGKCVQSIGGNILDGCEEIMAAAPILKPPAPVVVPPPVVVAVAPPKPKPVVRPPPIIKVLSLNESGGSNFAFDSAKLSEKGRGELVSFVTTVKSSNVSPQSVTVVGHTDSTGPEAYNQKLSERRANSVASFLASQGINRGVMTVSGRGESQPVASNKSKAGRAQNRRVDIAVKGQRKVTVRQ